MTAPRHRVVYDGPGDVWFFAYGSLMWDAPFPVAETRPALYSDATQSHSFSPM